MNRFPDYDELDKDSQENILAIALARVQEISRNDNVPEWLVEHEENYRREISIRIVKDKDKSDN